MLSTYLIIAYFSPETFLPVTSIVATVFGLVMMFGRTTIRLISQGVRSARRHQNPTGRLVGPHFQRVRPAKDDARKQVVK